MPARPLRTSVFISYSHKDRAYLEQFQTHLKPWLRDQTLNIWDDTQIKPGERWREQIEGALAAARVGVLLVSENFFASNFIAQNELPPLLESAQREGAMILPVIVRPCPFEKSVLEPFQGVNAPDAPLSDLSETAREQVWVKLITRIREILASPHPPGIQVQSYQDHRGSIKAIAWSPDGARIASAGKDNTVHVWNAATGDRLVMYQEHTQAVEAVTWSPDGLEIASGSSDATVQIWGSRTGKTTLTYTNHRESIRALAWSPNGIYLASGDQYRSTAKQPDDKHPVCIWTRSAGKTVLAYQGHTNMVLALAWSPDGKRIASASMDDPIHVWEAATGKLLLTYPSPLGFVFGLAWSPDGNYLASSGLDMTVQVWQAATGRRIFSYQGLTSLAQQVAWSPDGKQVATANLDGTVHVWQVTTGQQHYMYQGHSVQPVRAVAWSPEGQRIASAGDDTTVQVWTI